MLLEPNSKIENRMEVSSKLFEDQGHASTRPTVRDSVYSQHAGNDSDSKKLNSKSSAEDGLHIVN
jgi:hypothetical protein